MNLVWTCHEPVTTGDVTDYEPGVYDMDWYSRWMSQHDLPDETKSSSGFLWIVSYCLWLDEMTTNTKEWCINFYKLNQPLVDQGMGTNMMVWWFVNTNMVLSETGSFEKKASVEMRVWNQVMILTNSWIVCVQLKSFEGMSQWIFVQTKASQWHVLWILTWDDSQNEYLIIIDPTVWLFLGLKLQWWLGGGPTGLIWPKGDLCQVCKLTVEHCRLVPWMPPLSQL